MAKTGPTFAPITPARRASGMSEVERFPEGSANTHTIGAPAILSGGYIDEAGANPTALYEQLYRCLSLASGMKYHRDPL